MSSALENKRKELQAVDDQLMKLFKQRMDLIAEIKRIKSQKAMDPHQEEERLKKLQRFMGYAQANALDPAQIQVFYDTLHQLAVEHQNR